MVETKMKLCGLRREADIRVANELLPDYIGFVFAAGARRAVTPETARELRGALDPRIKARKRLRRLRRWCRWIVFSCTAMRAGKVWSG